MYAARMRADWLAATPVDVGSGLGLSSESSEPFTYTKNLPIPLDQTNQTNQTNAPSRLNCLTHSKTQV